MELEIKKTISFIQAPRKTDGETDFSINLTKRVRGLHEAKYQAPTHDIGEGEAGRVGCRKTRHCPERLCRLSAIPPLSPQTDSTPTPRFIWGSKRPTVADTAWKEKNKVRGQADAA